MADNIVALRQRAGPDPLIRRYPGSVGLAAIVELLTWAPLDENPGLCKISTVIMSIDEIIENDGELFMIAQQETP